MKNPSIHIYLTDLKLILDNNGTVNSEKTLQDLMDISKRHTVHRSLIVTTKTNKKKLIRAVSDHVEDFNRILNDIRVSKNHRNVRNILHGDRLYLILCDIARDAQEFSELNGLTINAGFKKYCQIGLKKIGRNYRLNKFVTYKEWIFSNYDNYIIVKDDKSPDLTLAYAEVFVHKYGIKDKKQAQEILKNYHHDFVYCKEQAEGLGAEPKQWINAQFKGFVYLDTTPEPYQLHGEEATKRFLANKTSTKKDWRDKAREL